MYNLSSKIFRSYHSGENKMINTAEIIRQMTNNTEAMCALVQNVSTEQAHWKPNPETWSLIEVMAHVYNEERMDFRMHMKEMLENPPKAWGELHQGYTPVQSVRQALEDFILERQASIAWLKSLAEPDWETTTQASFGPANVTISISAGDVFASWVEHDYLHLRQIIELLHAWNEKQSSPFSLEYAGGW
jgi:hypothetical protein